MIGTGHSIRLISYDVGGFDIIYEGDIETRGKNLCPINLRSNKNALLSFAFIGRNCLLSNNLSNLLNVSKATNVIFENHYHISHKITKYLLDKYIFF